MMWTRGRSDHGRCAGHLNNCPGLYFQWRQLQPWQHSPPSPDRFGCAGAGWGRRHRAWWRCRVSARGGSNSPLVVCGRMGGPVLGEALLVKGAPLAVFRWVGEWSPTGPHPASGKWGLTYCRGKSTSHQCRPAGMGDPPLARRQPTSPTAPLPAQARSGWPSPAYPAGSRTCGGCASPARAAGRGRYRGSSSRW